MEQTAPRRYTVEEYLALEQQSDVRHEYLDGYLITMAGASIPHNLISGNFYVAFRQALRGKSCRAVIEAVQLAADQGSHYTYPDVMISCDPADQKAERTMQAPVLLVEVLSPSTGDYDRGIKFNSYKRLPSLRHYLLVSQVSWLVEWYRREPNDTWSYTPLVEATDALVIPELSINLTVAEIYEDTGVAQLRVVVEEPEAPYGWVRF